MKHKKNQSKDVSKLEREISGKNKRKNSYISKWLFYPTLSAITLGFLTGSYFFYTANSKLKEEKDKLFNENISYMQTIVENNQEISNLKKLNKEGIIILEEKVDELKQKMPVGGLFDSLDRLVGGIGMFNEIPLSTDQLESILLETQSSSEDFDNVWEKWKFKKHGIQNYVPKLPWVRPPKIGDGEDTVVQQDFGKNFYILILGYGHHNGIDLTSNTSRGLYSSFDGIITGDRTYPERGRMISIKSDNKDEEGYQYLMRLFHLSYDSSNKYGQKIKKGDFIANYGNTGFVNGPHLHVEFLRSIDGKRWEYFDAFENKTYKEGENIVWFNFWNVPDSIKELIKTQIDSDE